MILCEMTAMLDKNIKFKVKDINSNLCTEEEIRDSANYEEISHIEMENIDGISTMIIYLDYENGATVKNWKVSVNINLFEDVEITCTKDEKDDKKFMTKKVVEALREKTLNITIFDVEIDNVDEA